MNIISIKDFYKINDTDKETLIEDIFYCKQEHDNKPNSKGINTNFCVHLDRANVLEKIYDLNLDIKLHRVGFQKEFIIHGTRDYIYSNYNLDFESVFKELKSKWGDLFN